MLFATFWLHAVLPGGRCGCGDPLCDQAGKHPSELWSQTPDDRNLKPTLTQGVGIPTGKRSGIFVIDLDLKDGKDGLAELRKLGDVPVTYTVATPTGGYHLYFQWPGFRVRNSGPKSNPLALGIDIRGDGGYVVAPGSPHANGGRYEVAVDAPIAEAPAWLLAWDGLGHADAQVAEPASEVETVQRVPREWRVAKAKAFVDSQAPAVSGNGGDSYTWTVLTRAVHDWCLTDEDMINDAFLAWNARCEPPWEGAQWAHKIRKALNGSTKPWNSALDMQYAAETRLNGAAPANTSAELVAKLAGELQSAGDLPFKLKVPDLDAPLPPLLYQIDSLIVKSDVVMLVAHGNSLKTWAAFSLALAVSTGRPWLGRYPTLRGKVAVMDFESGEYEVMRRLKLLGGKNADVDKRMLVSSYSGAQLADPESWVKLAGLDLDLLVIDSFRATHPETDENDARADMVLQHAAKFADAMSCTVIFIHHSRKGNGGDRRESVRGSTAIFAACDRIFEFVELDKGEDGSIKVTMASVKDGAGARAAEVRLELTDKGLRWVEPDKKEPEKPAKDQNREIVFTKLRARPAGIPKADLVNVMKGRRDTRFECLSQMLIGEELIEYKSEKKLFIMLKPGFEP
jgi:hypothetical protein